MSPAAPSSSSSAASTGTLPTSRRANDTAPDAGRQRPLPAVRADETRALTSLTFSELRGAVGGIESVHQAIAGRAFRAGGPAAAPVQRAHNAIAGGVYGGVRSATETLAWGVDRLLARRPVGEGRSLSTAPAGSAVLGIVDGLIGDTLARERSPLVEPMSLRIDGRVVDLSRPALRRAYPHASGRLVVFLHGLMETEYSWRRGGQRSYGERLEEELGASALEVRFNTGRHISENGRTLADLLATVAAEWPVPVREIALVGHSMGGLVARAACHLAAAEEAAWVKQVRHVISLGSPHMGAPLEQAVHLTSAALHRVPETRPLARFLRRRSGGIRDLRHGSLVDDDWSGRDADALRAAAVQEVPLLEGAVHCFVAATVTRSPRHPVGRVVGDCLVLAPSASGRSRKRRLGFRDEDGMHLGGVHHFALLNHPLVYEQLNRWLRTPPEGLIEGEAEEV